VKLFKVKYHVKKWLFFQITSLFSLTITTAMLLKNALFSEKIAHFHVIVFNLKTTSMKNLTLLLFCTALSFSVSAQSASDQQKAFKTSYEHEIKGDYTGAIKDLKSVYSETSYELNLRLGWLHYAAGLFTESMAYYTKSINLMPASVEAKFGYVYPAAALGNWDQVKNQYEGILRIDPKNSQAHYRLGLIYYGREEFDSALQQFQVGANLYPFDYDYNLMLAWTSLKMGKMREAKILFNKVLMISPGDESAVEGMLLIK